MSAPAIAALGERAWVARAAEGWLGTPYHNHGRVKQAGVDCGQLLLAVFAEAGLIPEMESGPYAPDWHLHHSDELYLGWVERWCVPTAVPGVGDIALFRYGRCLSHGGIVVRVPPRAPHVTIIHAYRGEGVRYEEVCEGMRLWPRLAGYWTFRRWADAECTT